MARSSSSTQCDSIASYMDGVQVMVAEAYKPPKKIVLPPAYYSKLPDVSKYTYDTSLEKNVVEKMKEWRKARISHAEARRARLEEKRKKEAEKSPPPSSPDPTSSPLPIKNAPAPEATILTPQLLLSPANDTQNHTKVNGGYDYSDFDNDTSSPFDNMELKTINEMEELEKVLQQPTTSQWTPNPNLEAMLKDMTMEQKIDEFREEEKHIRNNSEAVNNCTNPKQTVVSLIVQELQKELERPIAENWRPWPDPESPEKSLGSSSEHSLSNNPQDISRTFTSLSAEDQKLARRLSDMGFPLSRVVRAIRDFEGQDNKKIVEYLLAIQSLEDFGMSEDAAIKALRLTQYDQHKAKVYYESLCKLRDLGFPEDKVSMALLKCNIDQDSALDLLIA